MSQQINYCKQCKRKITWEDQRFAFTRLTEYDGYDPEVIKPIFPSHLKCAKKAIKDAKIDKISKSTID